MDDYKEQLIAASDLVSSDKHEKALSILLPLVEKEVPGALGILGLMYQLGTRVPKAAELLTRAYKLGDGASAHKQFMLWGNMELSETI